MSRRATTQRNLQAARAPRPAPAGPKATSASNTSGTQPTTTAKPVAAPNQKVSVWVKLLVAFHLIAITVWAMPEPPAAFKNGTVKWAFNLHNPSEFAQSLNDGIRLVNSNYLRPSPIKYYDLPTGFWQYWDMFAPNPASADFYGDAEITYQDGSHKIYTYPRMSQMNLFEKYEKERYRKFYERANSDDYQFVWPAFAQRIALLNATDPNNLPTVVALRRHWQDIPEPGNPLPTTYQSYQYYRQAIDLTKLRHDLGVQDGSIKDGHG